MRSTHALTAVGLLLSTVACSDDPAAGIIIAPDAGAVVADAASSGDAGVQQDGTDAATSTVTDGGAMDAGFVPDAGSIDAGRPPAQVEVPIAGGTFGLVRDGLFGGVVVDVQRSPADRNRLYAATDGAGLFRSDDGGRTWQPTALDVETVTTIVVHPTDVDRLWVLRRGARAQPGNMAGRSVDVLRSEDGAASFTDVVLPAAVTRAVQLAASAGATWLAGYVDGGTAVFRTLDRGATWQSTAHPNDNVQHLVAHATDADIAWTANQQTVRRTGDGGASFTSILPALNGSEFPTQIVASVVRPGRLWLSLANGGVHRSDDGGQTWTELSGGRTFNLFPSTTDADVIWASDATRGVLVSTNAGATFRAASGPRESFMFRRPRFAPADASEAIAYGTIYEAMLTSDGGTTWTRSVEGLSATWINAVAVSPDGTRVVVGDDHGAVFVSEDRAVTFTRSTAGLPPLAVTALAIDPSEPSVVYLGTGNGTGSLLGRTNFAGSLYKSIDGGITFSRITSPRQRDYVLDIARIVVEHDGAVHVREGESFPARSDDGGLTWTPLQPTIFGILTDRRRSFGGPGSLLTGRSRATRSLFIVSSDGASSWTEITGPTELGLNDIDLALSSRVDELVHYTKTSRAFARYSGSVWGRAEVGLSATPGVLPDLRQVAVAADNGTDRLVAIGSTYEADALTWSLHVSHDGAARWTTTEIPFVGVPVAIAAAEDTGDLFVVGLVGGRGLLVTRTGGR